MAADTTKKKVAEWMTARLIEWEQATGQRKTVTELAEHIGAPQSLVSRWLSGKNLPGDKYIPKIAESLGAEIYDLLGKKRPDPYEQSFSKMLDEIPSEEKKQAFFEDVVRLYLRTMGEKFVEFLKDERSGTLIDWGRVFEERDAKAEDEDSEA